MFSSRKSREICDCPTLPEDDVFWQFTSDDVFSNVELLALLVELLTLPVELLTLPVELVTMPVELVTMPVELVTMGQFHSGYLRRRSGR